MSQFPANLTVVTALLIFLVAAFTNLLVYIAFRPFSVRLLDKILLAVLSVGLLGAILGTILREQSAAFIPLNFVISAAILAAWMTAFHFLERLLFGNRF